MVRISIKCYIVFFGALILTDILLRARILFSRKACTHDANIADAALRDGRLEEMVVKELESRALVYDEDSMDEKTKSSLIINYRKSSWMRVVTEILERSFANHTTPLTHSTLRESIDDSEEVSHSSFQVERTPSGIDMLNMTNVCLSTYGNTIQLFSPDGSRFNNTNLPSNFPPSWEFSTLSEPFPRKKVSIRSSGVYMMMSHSNRNIAHFMEVFNFVYHFIEHIDEFPWITHVLLPQFSTKQVYTWITSYVSVAQSVFPKDSQFSVLYSEEIKKLSDSKLVCFRQLYGIGRISHIAYGGIFLSQSQLDIMRASTYKFYNVQLSSRSYTLTRVVLIERENVNGNLPGRAIANIDEVRSFFKSNHHYWLKEARLELMTPQNQIELMSHTDVLLGVLGSGFANVIYMLPHSVSICYSPPNIGGFFFHTLSELANLYYIGVYNSSVPLPSVCTNKLVSSGESSSKLCTDRLYSEDIYMQKGQLNNLLRLATTHVKLYKYRISYEFSERESSID